MGDPRDKMFQVLVVGGIALLGPVACGDVASDGNPKDASAKDGNEEAFPTELGAPPADATVQIDAFPSELPVSVDAFPSELATFADAGPVDATVQDAFPSELPTFIDASEPKDTGSDARHDAAVDTGFPIEK